MAATTYLVRQETIVFYVLEKEKDDQGERGHVQIVLPGSELHADISISEGRLPC